jgi:hypothetical protein
MYQELYRYLTSMFLKIQFDLYSDRPICHYKKCIVFIKCLEILQVQVRHHNPLLYPGTKKDTENKYLPLFLKARYPGLGIEW